MTTIGTAVLQIIPSLDGVSAAVQGQLGGLPEMGRAAGRQLGDGLAAGVDAASKKVEAATGKIAAANRKVEDSAGKVRVAEAQLQSLRERGITDAGRLAAAEEKVATAQRNLQSASTTAANATSSLERAERQLAEASERAATAQQEAGRAAQDTASRQGALSGTIGKVGEGFSSLTGKAKELATAIGPTALAAAAPAALGAIGSALMAVGGTFDDVIDTIRVGTGASGEALDDLVSSAKKVGSEVPADFGAISTTVADLNTRLGLTGQPLETLTKQFVELARITGTEVDINGMSAAFQAFGVQGEQTSIAMDELFRVSQATGVGVNELAAAAVKGAPQLKQFGFTLAESAGLTGALDKAGIDSTASLAAMQKAMVNLAKDGKSGKAALDDVVIEVDKLIQKGNEAGAINAAAKMFGTKGAGQFVEAIRAGTLATDDFVAATGATEDTILGLGEETADFAEQWQMFKNKVLLTIEPIASRLFGLIGEGFSWFADRAVPAMQSFGDVAKEAWNSDGVQSFIGTVTSLFDAVWPKLVDGFNLAKSVAGELAPIVSTVLVGAFNVLGTAISTVVDIGVGIVKFFTDNKEMAAALGVVLAVTLGPAFVSMAATATASALAMGLVNAGVIANTVATNASAIASKAWAAAQWILNAALSANPIGLIVIALAALAAGLVYAWKNSETFRDIVTGAWNWIKDAALAVVSWFTDTALPFLTGVWESIKSGWNTLVESAQAVWSGIRDKFTQMIDFVTGLPDRIKAAASGMWDGIRDAFKGAINWIIRAWNSLEFKIPGFKVGPVGYDGFTLGVPDIAEFFDGGHTGPGGKFDVAGIVHADEFVLSKRARGMLEAAAPGDLDFMNKTGQWPGFAEGGRVGYGFKPGTSIAYGNTKAFPEWVQKIADKFGVLPSTYGGHQEASGQNRGIDWQAPGYPSDEAIAKMQAFAEYLRSIPGQVEQVIWNNQKTGEKIGVADGKLVGPGTDQPGYYRDDWAGHQNHVHTRFSQSIADEPAKTESPAAVAAAATDPKADGTKPTETKTETPAPTSSAGGGSYPTTISGWAGFIGENFVGGQIKSLLSVFGIPDSPSWMKAGSQLLGGIKVADKDGKSLFDGSNPLAGITGAADGKQQTPTKKTDDSTAGPGAALPLTGLQGTPTTKAIETLTSTLSAPKADYKGGNQGTYDTVYKAFRDAGYADGQWGDLVALINQESGWNPEARNPSSDAYGLGQFLTQGNIDKYLGGKNRDVPVDTQATAIMQYIRDRYGDPAKAWAFHQKNNWYADGGRVKPFLYDAGGWLPQGAHIVENKSGGPEPILTQDYWSTAKSAIDVAQSMVAGQTGGKQLPAVSYTINARDTEDAFIRAQRQERERAAAKLSKF